MSGETKRKYSRAEQVKAIRRVLRRCDEMLSMTNPPLTMMKDGEMWTHAELRQHVRAALKLPILKQKGQT